MAKKGLFPRLIYVKWELCHNEDPYLVASKTPDGEDGDKVAIYVLKEVKTRRVVESLV